MLNRRCLQRKEGQKRKKKWSKAFSCLSSISQSQLRSLISLVVVVVVNNCTQPGKRTRSCSFSLAIHTFHTLNLQYIAMNKDNNKIAPWKQKEFFFLVIYASTFYVIIIRRSLQLSHGIFLFQISPPITCFCIYGLIDEHCVICFYFIYRCRSLQTTIRFTPGMAHT